MMEQEKLGTEQLTEQEKRLSNEVIEEHNPSDATLTRAYAEIMATEREVEIAGLGKVKLYLPSNRERIEADIEYSKAFTELLEKGLKTADEMMEIVKKRGLWTEEHEKRLAEIDRELRQQVLLYAKAQTDKTRVKIRKRIAELRREQLALQSRRRKYIENCVESRADEARFAYLLHKCVKHPDGRPVWPTLESFYEERRMSVVSDILVNYMLLYYGVSQNLLESLPAELVDLGEIGEPDGE